MSRERTTTVLVVAECPSPQATALLEREGVDGRTVAADDAAAAVDREDPDCLVVCTASLPTAVVTTAAGGNVPIVECEAGAKADDGLLDQVHEAISKAKRRDTGRIARLHAGSAKLIGLTDRDAVFDSVVAIASSVLDFDTTVVYAAVDAGFERVAVDSDTAVPATLDAEHGLTAAAFRSGESVLVGDIQRHPVAASTTGHYRSGVVVPFGDDYVFEGLATEPHVYDDSDLELAGLLCDHAAQAEARLAAESHLQERERMVTALHRAAPRLIDAEDETTLFERTVAIAEGVLDFDRSYLLMAEGDEEFVCVAGTDDDVSTAPLNAGIFGQTFEEGRPFLVHDVRQEPTARPVHESTRSVISVPFGDSGVFQAISTESHAFTDTDVELAELLASYASATRDRIRSEAALRESRRVVERLHDAGTDLAAAETEGELLDSAITAAEDVLSFDKCMIALREGEMVVPVAESAESPENASRPMHVTEGMVGKTVRTGESFRLDRVASDPDADPVRPEYRSAISVPIGDLGVFQAVAYEVAAFDDDDLDRAELLMAHVSVSLERVHADADRRAERDRLQALFENIPGAAVAWEMVDGKPMVRRVNEAFERTFGYRGSEVTGENLDEYIVPPDHEADATEYNDRLECGERVQAEVERLTSDGAHHFLMQVIPLEMGQENSRGYAVYSDVTEQKRREEELRRQNERLDEFASVVSHDLRNPLNVAEGYLELARETGDPEQFDRVRAALGRMEALITDLLVLARKGRDVGETESVALDEVARRAWANVSTGDTVLRVETETSVDADADRLLELFENLFRNSVEHGSTSDRTQSDSSVEHGSTSSRPGADDSVEHGSTGCESADGESLTVTVGDLTGSGSWTGFFVDDDGEGIDADIDPFEAGTTTSENGTGFGLAIVKSVAEAHGWAVAVGQSENGGARFDFSV